ncbi:MAG: hypothetical protein RL141_560 [Candidatus Parcubacteria bacterium]|jgi:hypothetical protein
MKKVKKILRPLARVCRKQDFSRRLTDGELYIRSTRGTRQWLLYVASIWGGAAGVSPDPNGDEVQRTLATARAVAEKYAPGNEAGVQRAFTALCAAIRALWEDHPALVKVKGSPSEGVSLRWDGSWTEGRRLLIKLFPNGHCRLTWATGTGRESRFLALPSSAIQYARQNPGDASVYRQTFFED